MIEDINTYLINILWYSKEEIIGKKIWEIGSFKDANLSKEAFLELASDHYIRYDNLPLETKGGKKIFVEFAGNVYECNGINIIQCNIRDNTSRHIVEIERQRVWLDKKSCQHRGQYYQNLSFPWPIAEMIHQHHERMYGSGYPGNLKGDALLLEAKIIAVACVKLYENNALKM